MTKCNKEDYRGREDVIDPRLLKGNDRINAITRLHEGQECTNRSHQT